MYALSSQPEQHFKVSHAIEEWVPKYKILEVVELLALRVNHLHEIELKVG